MSFTALRHATKTVRPVGMPVLKGCRTIITPTKVQYTASATATGGGRTGSVTVSDAVAPLNAPFKLALPKAMGGNGDGVNPEQIFSAGYSACYLGALHAAAKKAGKEIPNASVEVLTSIGPEEVGFALLVELKIKGVNDQSIVDLAHKICPYSKALKYGVQTKSTLV
ncbi:15763_t:CDS:2 [Acaulospora colombiana]|uniref:15763_t:CDS:1 n=1 Tax=Acaulospora colombiana TaxID=27376 RepID=A0ACA9PEU1_9GLOM|nr:15763_t:CDS:2 [Acaulospora colombiana]